jgi:hypothetical protein
VSEGEQGLRVLATLWALVSEEMGICASWAAEGLRGHARLIYMRINYLDKDGRTGKKTPQHRPQHVLISNMAPSSTALRLACGDVHFAHTKGGSRHPPLLAAGLYI